MISAYILTIYLITIRPDFKGIETEPEEERPANVYYN